MIPNNSPWVKQLNRVRPVSQLDRNLDTDVVIVGGGIAGIVTAYFTLKNTSKKVILIEAGKVAHGATGHNAGHLTSYMEISAGELMKLFGQEMVMNGISLLESAWSLLEEIYQDTALQTPHYKLTGYGGYSTLEQIISVLEDNMYRKEGALKAEEIFIAENSNIEKNIPEKYRNLYKTIPHLDLLSLIETNDRGFIACSSYEEGCMNSALFCEELLGYMISKYIDRLSLYEESPVNKIFLMKDSGIVKTKKHSISSKNIVLCTNGFENFNIINEAGDEIDLNFHHSVNGRIGYMAGYLEPINKPPFAVGYFPENSKYQDDPTGSSYFYITRRPYEGTSKESYNLICGGGPEIVLPNHASYSMNDYFPEDKQIELDEMFIENYKNYKIDEVEHAFYWHGLMGYTPNRVRRIGFEPINKVLLYNLGCNGVGIIPSIYGGKRISQLLNGEQLEKSIFDPHDPRIIYIDSDTKPEIVAETTSS